MYGIEYDPDFVKIAQTRLTSVVQADLNHFSPYGLPRNFDLVVFADILEHTIEPKQIMKKIIEHCASDKAEIIVSVPNVQHITVIKNLLIGVWPQNTRGIFDSTHLRWFTLRTIEDLAMHINFDIDKNREEISTF